MAKIGYLEEAPGVKSIGRFAVLWCLVLAAVMVVLGAVLARAGEREAASALIYTGGGLAVAALTGKTVSKFAEKP